MVVLETGGVSVPLSAPAPAPIDVVVGTVGVVTVGLSVEVDVTPLISCLSVFMCLVTA